MSFAIKILVVLFAFNNIKCVPCQHIYENPCSYNLSTDIFNFNSDTIRIPRKRTYEIYINLCTPVNIAGCDSEAFACVLNAKSNFNIRNAGKKFEISLQDGEFVLKSKNSQSCNNGDSNYQVFIHLDNFKVETVIQDIDDCELHIRMFNPNSKMNSVTQENNYLINMLPLKNMKELIITKDNKIFALSFWKPADSCSSKVVAGCEILNEQKNSISLLQRQHVVYNAQMNTVAIRSNNGGKRSNKIVSDILVKCNWNVEFANPTKLLAKYKFQIESKYGCVKLPMNCSKIVDDQHFTYNISKLNKPQGWKVATSSGSARQILLNVCGPLKLNLKNQCSETFSQICDKDKNLNYGSTYTQIKEIDDVLHLHLNDGSTCIQNNTQKIHTHIQFICALVERGPVLTSEINCINEIVWETPEACPKMPSKIPTQIKSVSNLSCIVTGNNVTYDLMKLSRRNGHYTVKVGNYEYKINVCAPIVLDSESILCSISGGCLFNLTEPNIKKKYFSFGQPKNPIIENNNLLLKYTGGVCKLGITREIIIHFYCLNEERGLQFLKKSDCVHEFSWYTKSACPISLLKRSLKSKVCKITNGKYEFDWLISHHLNITFKGNTYLLNLCNGEYTISTDTLINTQRKSDLILKRDLCIYYIDYKMMEEICGTSFIKLRIYLQCDYNQDEPVYSQLNEPVNCTVSLKIKSLSFCNLQQKYDCDKNASYASNYYEETSLKYSETIITGIPINTDIIRNESIASIEEKVLKCNPDLNLKDTPNVQLFSLNRTLYSIGYGIVGCDDLICKNNKTVGSLSKDCPSVKIDYLGLSIQFKILGVECGQNFFITHIDYICSSDITESKIIEESLCSVKMVIPNSKFCNIFNKEKAKASTINKGVLIFGISMCILFIVIIVVYLYRNKTGYQRICLLNQDKRSTPIYVRQKIGLKRSSNGPPASLLKNYEKFQEENGIPVYLKGGFMDRIVFSATIGMIVIGLSNGFYTLYRLAIPKKK